MDHVVDVGEDEWQPVVPFKRMVPRSGSKHHGLSARVRLWIKPQVRRVRRRKRYLTRLIAIIVLNCII